MNHTPKIPRSMRKKSTQSKSKQQQYQGTHAFKYTKRHEITDADGWTHVIHAPQTRTQTKPKQLQACDFELHGVPYVHKSIAEVEKEFEYCKGQWESSSASASLRTLTEELKAEGIENAVVLGLGSLQAARREGRRCSATQVASVLTMLEQLGGALRVVAQDPLYTDVDEKFLTTLGWTVVQDPDAFEMIGENSLVFAVHCYNDVYRAVARCGKRPAVFVGTKVDSFGRVDSSEHTTETIKTLKAMLDNYKEIDFPQWKYDFSDTKIYCRRTHLIDVKKPF